MKILHTADWHLGKKLDFYNRIDEQRKVLAEICQIAEADAVDAVVVAGDLFDTFNPPIEATELLYKILKKLTRNGTVPVIAIAGNHDSPDRINVADVLARENGIIFIGHPTDKVPLFEVENGFSLVKSEPGFIEIKLPQYSYPLRVLHTAFANEVRLKEYFGEDKQQSLQESLSRKWQELADTFCDDKGVNLLTSHLYVAPRGGEKPEEPEGEKPLNIGNADVVYSDAVPTTMQYVAMGHLHRYQNVGTKQPVIYSGSPLQYSFSEAGQTKHVAIVKLEPGKEAVIEKLPLKEGKPLIRKSFPNVEEAVIWLNENPNCLLEMTLEMDQYLKADERKALSAAHKGIIHLIPKVKNPGGTKSEGKEINLNQNMEQLFSDYFRSKNEGQVPNKDIMELFNEILNS